MDIYPYSSPIILTDAIFSLYGGETGTSTQEQRAAVYLIAEKHFSEALDTFLLPTIVTGTYFYDPTHWGIVLGYTYVHRIIKTSFFDVEENEYWSQLGTDNVYVSLRDDARGVIDIHSIIRACNCYSSYRGVPYQIKVVYEAGLPTGTANQPDFLLALVSYAQIMLNELIGFGNEAPGDIGVQEYRNQQYAERRVSLGKTSFGSSAKAQFINRIINKYRKRTVVGL